MVTKARLKKLSNDLNRLEKSCDLSSPVIKAIKEMFDNAPYTMDLARKVLDKCDKLGIKDIADVSEQLRLIKEHPEIEPLWVEFRDKYNEYCKKIDQNCSSLL